MSDRLRQLCQEALGGVVELRRDLHRHPELGWCEYRTTALVQERLEALTGISMTGGRDLYRGLARLGLPERRIQDEALARARAGGVSPDRLEAMKGGWTGVSAELAFSTPGPVVAVRADLDALPLQEKDAAEHNPAREGFASVVPGVMHACAHDAHSAVVVGLAEVLANMGGELGGRVRFLFQPAEEGTRGADAFVRAGLLDDVDYVLTFHFLSNVGLGSGEVAPGISQLLPTRKFVVHLEGEPSQFASSPQRGRNALTVASAITLLSHALPRAPGSRSMVNVGRLEGGTAANIVPASAKLVGEVRADDQEDLDDLVERFGVLCRGLAAGFGVRSRIEETGYSTDPRCDEDLMEVVASAITASNLNVREPVALGASDDAALMIDRVQGHGGQGTYVAIGSEPYRPHHSADFDIDESVLGPTLELLTRTVLALSRRPALHK